MGGKKETYKIKLPDGKEVPMHNGDKGFFLRHVHTLRVLEGLRYRFRGVKLQDKLQIGKRGMNSFPGNKEVSKHHVDVACVNNYYFFKDAGSKHGTYIKIGGSQNKRIELHKGMTFSVGKLHLKVSQIEGDAADNRKLKAKLEAERAAKEADRKSQEDAKPAVDLDSDEEFADDSDDEDTKKGGKGGKGKLDGPPVMFLTPVNKKDNVKGRIRETSTIGSKKEDNKIHVPEEKAKEKAVDGVHTRIVLEDGHFYLEDAGSHFGTYVGLPKKKFFEVNGGDHFLFGSAKAQIEYIPVSTLPFTFLDGLIDKILGDMGQNMYDVKLCGKANIQTRMKAARKEHLDDE